MGKKLEGIEIPEGNWKLCFFVIHRYRQPVGKAAPGAEGLVIDHCSRKAMDCFLENMAQPLTDRLGKGTVDSFFCDSIECDGHNWSSELLEAFEQRRGYDLRKFIYALWGDMGEITPHVRYDYFLTMSELTIENFFDPLTEWCRRNGSRSRIQAHGTWGDILRVYAAADEPEEKPSGITGSWSVIPSTDGWQYLQGICMERTSYPMKPSPGWEFCRLPKP